MEVTLLTDLLVASWSVVDPRLRGPGFDSVEENVVIGGSVSATGLREGNLDDGQVVLLCVGGWQSYSVDIWALAPRIKSLSRPHLLFILNLE